MGSPETQSYAPCEVSRAVERAVAAFEDAWLDGHPPSLETFLSAYSGSERAKVLREVVYIDLERRIRAGETARIETYAVRFPELVERREELLALLQCEFRLRRVHETDLTFGEYRARYPDLGTELVEWLALASCAAPTLPVPVDHRSAPDVVVPGYELLGELGSGGMGVVYKARHRGSGEVVALKLVRPDLHARPNTHRRFQREVQAAARLDHPHIVRVLDGGQAGDTWYMAMEYVEGETLHHRVEKSGRRAVWEACEFIRQTALGLHHAHEAGLVHRDIKPSNLMVSGDSAVKILDLGLVRIDESDPDARLSTLTQPGVLLGTIDFIAPEQAMNPHVADPRSDLYSLGCTFYYLLLGKVPFPVGSVVDKVDKHRWVVPRPVDRQRAEVPRAVAAVVDRLLAKQPEGRFRTAAEVADAVAPYCTAAACTAARAAQNAAPAPPASKIVPRPPTRDPAKTVGLLRRLTGHGGTVCGLALTADGTQLISASRDSTVRVWNPATTHPPRILNGHTGEVRGVVVSPAARCILSAGTDGTVRAWDLQTGRPKATLTGHTDAVKAVAVSDDGRLAVSAANDRRVILWDLQTGRKLWSAKGHTGDLNCVSFVPNAEIAVSGGWDKTLRIWDLATGKELWQIGGTFSAFQWSVFMGLAFLPDGSLLAGSSDHTLCLMDVGTGAVSRRFEGHTNWVASVAVSPDGRHALSGGWDGTVRLWDLAQGKAVACFEGHTDQVQSVVFAPDGRHAYSAGSDGTIIVWRVLA